MKLLTKLFIPSTNLDRLFDSLILGLLNPLPKSESDHIELLTHISINLP